MGCIAMLTDALRMLVKSILVRPIKCIGYSNGKIEIFEVAGVIKTTQTYYRNKRYPIVLDEDMSDFAVEFYTIFTRRFNYSSVLCSTWISPRKRVSYSRDCYSFFRVPTRLLLLISNRWNNDLQSA